MNFYVQYSLSENRIGDIGAAVLGEGLVNNETLWTLK